MEEKIIQNPNYKGKNYDPNYQKRKMEEKIIQNPNPNYKERGKRVKSNTKQRIEDVLAANEKPQFAMVKRNNYEEVVQRVNKHSKMISKAAFSSYYDSKAAKFTQWRGAGCSNGESKK